MSTGVGVEADFAHAGSGLTRQDFFFSSAFLQMLKAKVWNDFKEMMSLMLRTAAWSFM